MSIRGRLRKICKISSVQVRLTLVECIEAGGVIFKTVCITEGVLINHVAHFEAVAQPVAKGGDLIVVTGLHRIPFGNVLLFDVAEVARGNLGLINLALDHVDLSFFFSN